MPINAHPEYLAAEKEYLQAQTPDEKIEKLKKMISHAPGHKGAENLRAQLKTRLKKLQEKKESDKKTRSAQKTIGIRKEDMQAVILGFTNSGKSSLIKTLTNSQPTISPGEYVNFTTKQPIVAMMPYSGTNIQLIENPALESDFYDKGLTNTADTLLIIITNIEELENIKPYLEKSKGKRIIIFNKTDLLSTTEKRKISATLQSKKYNFIMISTLNPEKDPESIEQLKNKLFKSFGKIRVYTKEPEKNIEQAKQQKPVILEPDSTVRDVAEKILKGFSSRIKQTKIWGPSSKFSGQKIGLNHKLKDLDVLEFKTY